MPLLINSFPKEAFSTDSVSQLMVATWLYVTRMAQTRTRQEGVARGAYQPECNPGIPPSHQPYRHRSSQHPVNQYGAAQCKLPTVGSLSFTTQVHNCYCLTRQTAQESAQLKC